jgi:hypothetical protein
MKNPLLYREISLKLKYNEQLRDVERRVKKSGVREGECVWASFCVCPSA